MTKTTLHTHYTPPITHPWHKPFKVEEIGEVTSEDHFNHQQYKQREKMKRHYIREEADNSTANIIEGRINIIC